MWCCFYLWAWFHITRQSLASCNINGEHDFSLSLSDTYIELLPPKCEGVLTTSQKEKLQDVCRFLYPNVNFLHFSSFYEHSRRCIMANEMFTISSAKERSSVVMAVWPTENLSDDRHMQVGRIQRIIRHCTKTFHSGSLEERHHVFCIMDWYIKHIQEHWYGISATMCTNITYAESSCSYLPIQRICHRCAYGNLKVTIPPRHSDRKFLLQFQWT